MQIELEKMKPERTTSMARIATLEQGKYFAQVPPDYRSGMIAIERLVLNATRDDERPLLPAGDEEPIMEHLDKLAERIAHMANRRVEANEEERRTLLANRAMYDLLHFN